MKQCKKPKILFMLPTLGAGGAERILVTLLNNLNHEKFSPEFLALNDNGPIKEWIRGDIPFHSFGNKTIKTSVIPLFKFIKKEQPDIIFTTMVHSNALALLVKIFFPNIKVIVREAALPSVLVTKYGFKGRLCIFVYKLLYPKADIVISNCSQMVSDFEKVIKINTKNHKILFNPVDVERIYAELPKKIEKSETLRFVSVGRLSHEKGHRRLIKSLVNLNINQDWRLDIIGEGEDRKTLEDLIKKNALEDKVFLRGYFSNPWKIAANADCLLLPSHWEGMPNVVLEGFACGIPAIAINEAGGIMDIAKYADKSILNIVYNMDEFVQEMSNVKIRDKASNMASYAIAQKLPKEFSLPNVMKQFENILYSE